MTIADEFSDPGGWHPAQVPGTAHQDLLAAGVIPDPFYDRNELLAQVQALGQADFLYHCEFTLDAADEVLDVRRAPTVDLCCEGLDTFATIWVNGHEVLRCDNMFLPQRVAVTGLLRPGKNELWMLFEAALPKGQAREALHGKRAVWNGDASRVYVRKAQYHYGWDWGPVLLTAGPYRGLRLEAYQARIADVAAPAEISADLGHAALAVAVHIATPGAAARGDDLELELRLFDPEGAEVVTQRCGVAAGETTVRAALAITKPRLWWPAGQGAQHRYRLEVSLRCGGHELDRSERRLGLRRLRLLRDAQTAGGESFTFEINNRPLFCGGANWIPADSFLTRVDAERYRRLLTAAVAGNMNMLRVWGGGIYEEDVFYDLCDELGLLVWQDFMFACGLYPAEGWFQASVRLEAEANLRRLRHHPCIVLWCGNNEDYVLARSLGHYPHKSDADRRAFPATVIYEQLLAQVCAALEPSCPYWPGSPYGGEDPNAKDVGDRHSWEVWHGAMDDYQNYPRYAGRFVSEFGMQALPDVATLESVLPPEERSAESPGLRHHNKATDGPGRLHYYLHSSVVVPADARDLAGLVYASQLMQAEALDHAYRGFRRRFGAAGQRLVSGALVWQLEDCWPVTSWAIIDYSLRPKAAWFVIRRALTPLAVGLWGSAAGCAVWAVNGTAAAVPAELRLFAVPLAGGPPTGEVRRAVALPPDQALELGTAPLSQDLAVVCVAQLLVEGRVVSRATLWPQPLRALPDPGSCVSVRRDAGDRLTLRAERPVKGVWLAADGDVVFSDNLLDLVPGEDLTVTAAGLGDRELRLRYARAP